MDIRAVLTAVLVLAPFAGALLCALVGAQRALRSSIVLATGAVLILSAVALAPAVPFTLRADTLFGLNLHLLVQAADLVLLLIILYYGLKHKRPLIVALALAQLALVAWLEFFLVKAPQPTERILCDHLSLMMVLIISIVGSIICFQAIPYMHNHEHHYHTPKSRQPRFFFVMLLFLGAMNGLVLFSDVTFIYFFFEVTTVCSFLLIGHDRTTIATGNALRALWMNSLGGTAFALGIIAAYHETGSLQLQRILAGGGGSGVYLLALALLCIASFVKSAQFPFQSWLLGAMVAPTPVSALLHSSTMVKVGVYLVLRLAPGFTGTLLSDSIAVFGAFSFLAGAALAVGQSNGKKVLAYSTISNLGLIFACAGLNSAEAVTAAMLLLGFHAVIKAMLFLSVGAIEQHIASRDIEDMRGLYAVMPLTALITVSGVLMMIMPPFGVLLSKWMAMEAAARNLYVIVMIALGSALTVIYWARWAGTLMSDPFAGRFKPEQQPLLTWLALGPLCAGGALMSVIAPWFYTRLIVPMMTSPYSPAYTQHAGGLENAYGTFAVLPLSVVAMVGLAVAVVALKRAFRARIAPAYMSGIQTGEPSMFRGPMNQPVKAEAKNYYLDTIFGEPRLTQWVNLGGGILLTLILGGAL